MTGSSVHAHLAETAGGCERVIELGGSPGSAGDVGVARRAA
jgi:hypothetical protein